MRQTLRVESARVAIGLAARFVGIGQNFVARAAAFVIAAQVHIKHTGRNELLHAKKFLRIFPAPQRGQIREQLQLHAVFAPKACPAFSCRICNPVTTASAVVAAGSRHKSTRSIRPCSASLWPPPRSISHAGARASLPPKPSSAAAGSNSYWLAHPRHDDLDKILQRIRQRARRENASAAESRNRPSRKCSDLRRRRCGRSRSRASAGVKVAPAFAFRRQLLVENFQNFVLKTAAFARVQFKDFPFVRAQAGADKKLERALRKFLQPADGGFQNRAVKFFRQRGRKIFGCIRFAQRRAKLSAERFRARAVRSSAMSPVPNFDSP